MLKILKYYKTQQSEHFEGESAFLVESPETALNFVIYLKLENVIC